jgi:cyanate permease
MVTLIERIGLAPTLLFGAVLTLVVLLPITLVWIRDPPTTSGFAADAALRGPAWTRRQALKHTGFLTLTASSALALFAQIGFLVVQITFLTPRIGQAEAGVAVAITSGLSIAGRLSVGSVIDWLDPRLMSAAAYVTQAAALFGMAWTANIAALLIACAVFGFWMGNVLIFPALVIQREFVAPAFPMLLSFSTAIRGFVFSLAPGVLGILRDATGSFHVPLILCAALEIFAALIVLIRSHSCSPREPTSSPYS